VETVGRIIERIIGWGILTLERISEGIRVNSAVIGIVKKQEFGGIIKGIGERYSLIGLIGRIVDELIWWTIIEKIKYHRGF